jgi:hypothetical protein
MVEGNSPKTAEALGLTVPQSLLARAALLGYIPSVGISNWDTRLRRPRPGLTACLKNWESPPPESKPAERKQYVMKAKLLLFTIILAPTLGTLPADAKTFRLCEGSNRTACLRGDIYVPCDQPDKWAEATCKVRGSNQKAQYTIARLSQIRGGQCGYARYLVTCK